MKKTQFIHERLPMVKEFPWEPLNLGQSLLVLLTSKGFAKFYEDFTLPLLSDQVGKYLSTDMKQIIGGSHPTINLFSGVFRSLFRGVFSCPTPEDFINPVNKAFVGIGDYQSGLKIFIPIFKVFAVITDVEGPFSVHNSGHISSLGSRYFFLYNIRRVSRHACPVINSCVLVYNERSIKCTAAETNPDGILLDEVIVRPLWKHKESGRNDLVAA